MRAPLNRIALLFLAALAGLGLVVVLVPHSALGRHAGIIEQDFRRQRDTVAFRLSAREPLERLWAEYPALLGVVDTGGGAALRHALAVPPAPDAPAGRIDFRARPPVYVTVAADGRRFYFDATTLAALTTARRILLAFGLMGLAGLVFGAAVFARRVAAPYREMQRELAGATLPGGTGDDLQLVAGLRSVITQLRQREAELEKHGREARQRAEQSEAAFVALLAGADFPAGVYARGGRIRQANAPLRLLLRGADRLDGALARRLDRALDEGAPLLHEAWQQESGAEPLYASLLPVTARGERSTGLLLVDRDAAAAGLRRRLAEQAHLTRLGELGGVIAHETRNALAALRGRLQLLQREPGVPAGALAPLVAEIDGLESMVRAALDLARPEEARLEPLEPGAQAADAAARFRLDPVNPPLEVMVPADPPAIEADPRLLGRLLDNLLRNAAAACPDGPLALTLEILPAGVVFSVGDRGPGFPAALLAGAPASGAATGGFGLPLCRKWAGLLGADLRLENPPGGGARVSLCLPRSGENSRA